MRQSSLRHLLVAASCGASLSPGASEAALSKPVWVAVNISVFLDGNRTSVCSQGWPKSHDSAQRF